MQITAHDTFRPAVANDALQLAEQIFTAVKTFGGACCGIAVDVVGLMECVRLRK
jgi:hypothetical protein